MRTDRLLRHYAHTNAPAPDEGWERLLWMAAELVKRSQKERRTWRELRKKKADAPAAQPDLPNLLAAQPTMPPWPRPPEECDGFAPLARKAPSMSEGAIRTERSRGAAGMA